jgi:MFS transporter, DHA1 family, staphyloferrin B biosynthesis exporter
VQTGGERIRIPAPIREYLARLPLTDRITFSWDLSCALSVGVFTGLSAPLIPIVARRIGMSVAGISAMVTMQFVGALFGVLFGRLADKRRKMPFAIVPGLVGRSLIALLAFARTPVSYLVIASSFNFLSNLGSPAYLSIMRSNYSDANRSRLMGNVRVAIVVVSAVFSTVAGLVLDADENVVRWMFPVAAVFGVISSLTFARIKVRKTLVLPSDPTPPSFLASVRTMRRNTPFLIFMGILFLCSMPDKLAVPLEPIWLVDSLHLDYGEASFLLGTVVSLASVAGYVIWARALRRANSFSVLSVVVLLFAARFLALGLARTSHQLLPMCILTGLVNAGWDLVPIFCLMAMADRTNFSLYIGVHMTLFGVRGLAGPFIGTFLYTSGALPLNAIFILIAAALFLGAAMLAVFSRTAFFRVAARVRPALQ